MKQRALAIAIATAMVATGLSMAPAAFAGHNDCHRDFVLPDSEPVEARELGGNSVEIGLATVSAGDSEELTVELVSVDDTLEWRVFHMDGNDDCVQYKASSCSGTISSPGTDTCTLEDPTSGDKDYWVTFENIESDQLLYKGWSS